MTAQHRDFPPDFCGEVRLFPLSDLVMFPSNVLPLHIFESRYMEMLEDALRGDQLVAMATLTPGFEHDYFSRP
ncbi:MAG: LON peptidase substrate-binding domain-containing protein, partial [Pirellulaceae bacterium]